MQNSTLKLFCCPSNNQRRPVQEVGALGPWMTTCRDTNCTHTYISHINIFLNQENWLNYIQCMKYMNMKHPAPMPIHAMTCSKNKVYEVQNISNCHWLFSVLTVMTFLYRIWNKISHYSEQTCCSHSEEHYKHLSMFLTLLCPVVVCVIMIECPSIWFSIKSIKNHI